ncbi:MAG: hypothetical protein BAJALOKI1v1_30010 [Promethearchaeota archaeon]|nr:MAG: hypothetical protein BAJALOKI1v1_30010 [Candidatus Lokiarchaeota archaeon]
MDLEDTKVIFLGLDNAGKTSLLTRFGGKLDLEQLSKLEPTRGVERQSYESKTFRMLIWDFGGQKDHRSEYLQDPEEYFLDVNLIIYVIDLQDPDRFEESVDYFKGVLEILQELGEIPDILIFFHKFDPSIKNEEKTFMNIQKLNKLILPLFEGTDFNHESFLTSIYSGFPDQPKFTDVVKEIVDGAPLEQETLELKVERMGNILESTLNAIVKLSSNIMILDKKISFLEQNLIENELLSEIPPELSTEASPLLSKEEKDTVKKETLSQLKDVIIKKEKD